MHTKMITIKEYCELSGYSYKSKYVHQKVKEGTLLVGMVDVHRFGWAWMVEVLISWYDGKRKEDDNV